MYSSYGPLASEVYDIDKPIGHSFGNIEFYQDILSSVKGRILEPAMGTGRVIIPLIEAGHTVDGVDSSDAMLDICRKRCRERGITPLLVCGSLETVAMSHRDGAIIMPTGSFCHIEERKPSLRALDNLASHLDTGGLLVLDLIFPDCFVLGESAPRSWVTTQQELITLTTRLLSIDMIEQKTVSLLRYEKWKQGALVESELERFAVRWYGVDEFVSLLKARRFSVQLFTNYKREYLPTSNSDVVTVLARKKS